MSACLVGAQQPVCVITTQDMWPFPEVGEVREACRTHVWPLIPNRLRIQKPGWNVISFIFLSLG